MGRIRRRSSVGVVTMTHKQRTNARGAVLIVSIIVLFFLSVLGMSLIAYLYSQNRTVMLEVDRLKALYLAEAGIAKSIHELRNDTDVDNNGLGNVLLTGLGGGTCRAIHNFQNSTITGIGEYHNVKRRIQLQYSAL